MCTFHICAVVIIACLEFGMSQLPTNVTSEDINTTASYHNVATLYGNILNGYDKRVKPRKDQSEVVTVTFFFRIFGITEFDTASQKLSMLGFFYFQWRDDMLSWKPTAYGGIKVAKLPLKDIWSPGMMFIRDLQGNGVIGDPEDGVILSYTGDATWTPAGIFSIICDVSTKFYPFDRQSCVMSIYASDASTSEIRLMPSAGGITLEGYQNNSEWILVCVRVEKVNMSEHYYYHEFIIELERRSEFLIYTVISPLVLLSTLNVGIFIIPIDSGEKGSIAVTLFLSYGIFVTAIKGDLPQNSVDVSYVLIYIHILLMFSVFTVLYCFAESWVFSNRADEHVSLCCFRGSPDERKSSAKDVNPSAAERKELQEAPDDLLASNRTITDLGNERQIRKSVTWRKVLRWADICLMSLSGGVVLVATAIFLYYLSSRRII